MEGTMKSLQIVAPGKAEWRDVPIPQPGPGELLVRIEAVNTCPHWDLHLMEGRPMFPGGTLDYPYTDGQPGHEAMGTVAEHGPDVGGPPIGTRVAVWRDAGHHRRGCYAHYVLCYPENLLPIPDFVTSEQVTSLELAMCVQVSFDQLARFDAVDGNRFAVSGLGPAGLVALQMARAYGAAEVVTFDPNPERRDLAIRLGADRALDPDDSFPAERNSDGAIHAAIDCTGLKVSIEYLMERTRRAVAIFGVLRETVDYRAAYWGGLTLMGYENHNRAAAERALRLIADGHLDLTPLATHTLPFTRYAEGIELLRSQQALKIRFLPWEE